MTSATILADSINPQGHRLISALVTYPRYIHSEWMTHRAFSRNAASSRAIPFQTTIKNIHDNLALPAVFSTEKKGMQGIPIDPKDTVKTSYIIERIAQMAQFVIGQTLELQTVAHVHKSILNRYLEPFTHITALYTGHELAWLNFAQLRAHPAAEPTFQQVAYQVVEAILASTPTQLAYGEYHIPQFPGAPALSPDISSLADRIKIAVARCARLSYLTHGGDYSTAEDVALYNRLLESRHLSPFEHVAVAVQCDEVGSNFDYDSRPSGWIQHRKTIANEAYIPFLTFNQILENRL